jgi:16S rRNA (adenine1518-N6/adenine1519-N6)-dimethyltransferase
MGASINVRALLRTHGLRPKATWSQNFLVDISVIRAIAKQVAECNPQVVVELGAGLGALTSVLAQCCPRVVAVERDRDLARVLRSEFAGNGRVEVLEDNAATLDWHQLCARIGRPVVVGNLPYNIATPILFHLLEAGSLLVRFILMFQREMAARITAAPGSRRYGVLSIMVQQQAEVGRVLDVPPSAFFPLPKVHSRVLWFNPLVKPRFPVRDQKLFSKIVRGAFNQRRKTIRNALRSALAGQILKEDIERLLELAGITPTARPEQLSIETYAKLSDLYESFLDANALPSPGATVRLDTVS